MDNQYQLIKKMLCAINPKRYTFAKQFKHVQIYQ
jgi:hypothetical protein